MRVLSVLGTSAHAAWLLLVKFALMSAGVARLEAVSRRSLCATIVGQVV